MSASPSEPPPLLSVERLPPERGRGRSLVVAHGCCCCCCCCVHSVAGLAAGVAASIPGKDRQGARAVLFYWPAVSILSVLVMVGCGLREPLMGALVLALGLPAVQLTASVISLIGIVATSPDPATRLADLKRLGLITLVSLGAAVAGTIAMIMGGIMLSALK